MSRKEDGPLDSEASALGTKSYWDNAYTGELQNHASNPEDEGTIWFDDSGAEEKMLAFLEEAEIGSDLTNMENETLRVLDLGTGNGHLLFAMRDEGWDAYMLGLDYSEQSVKLAKSIDRYRRGSREASERLPKDVAFAVWDMLKEEPAQWLQDRFDIVLDKGTFDAISLNREVVHHNRKPCEIYVDRLVKLMKPGGIFLVTSCNWTTKELRSWFEGPSLQFLDTIRYPSFTFGGLEGQTVSSVCFRGIGQ